jgi:hypothetical protein
MALAGRALAGSSIGGSAELDRRDFHYSIYLPICPITDKFSLISHWVFSWPNLPEHVP